MTYTFLSNMAEMVLMAHHFRQIGADSRLSVNVTNPSIQDGTLLCPFPFVAGDVLLEAIRIVLSVVVTPVPAGLDAIGDDEFAIVFEINWVLYLFEDFRDDFVLFLFTRYLSLSSGRAAQRER